MSTLFEKIGSTPYPQLDTAEQVAFANLALDELYQVAEIAARQEPPNATVLSVVSALALTKSIAASEDPSSLMATTSVRVHRFAMDPLR